MATEMETAGSDLGHWLACLPVLESPGVPEELTPDAIPVSMGGRQNCAMNALAGDALLQHLVTDQLMVRGVGEIGVATKLRP